MTVTESFRKSSGRPPVESTGGRPPFIRRTLRVVGRYVVPVAGVAAMVGVGLAMEGWVGVEGPLLLFLLAVVVSAWGVGWGAGVAAVALAALAAAYFFLAPVSDLRVAAGADRVRLGLFAAAGLVTCAMCASLHAYKRRLGAEAARARALEGAVLEISDAEQRRIGQDLHDGVGQHLTGVALLAKALERRVAAEAPSAAGEAGRVTALVNEAIGRVREVARGLAPVELELGEAGEGGRTTRPLGGNLRAALEHLLAAMGAASGIGCRLVWEEAVRVAEPQVALHLYRIVQEAVSNAVKHGHATRVEVRVGRVGTFGLVASVVDDGIGIAEVRGRGDDDDGMGMRIMAYRCRLIGGELRIARGRGGAGTVVTCVVPTAGLATTTVDKKR